jgi:hypothetical protein
MHLTALRSGALLQMLCPTPLHSTPLAPPRPPCAPAPPSHATVMFRAPIWRRPHGSVWRAVPADWVRSTRLGSRFSAKDPLKSSAFRQRSARAGGRTSQRSAPKLCSHRSAPLRSPPLRSPHPAHPLRASTTTSPGLSTSSRRPRLHR